MKEFNLEAAKAGEPIQTREGTEVLFIGVDEYEGLVITKEEDAFRTYSFSGKCSCYCVDGCYSDLFMAGKKKVQRWVVPEGGLWEDTLWESLEKAKKDYPFELYREVEQ